jgi:peptidylprolyl isomerase
MKVGEKKTVTIPANEAYGPRSDDQIMEVPREKLPSGLTPKVGQQLGIRRQDGGTSITTITSVSDNTVTIDANHPLAGKDLTFEIELVKIQ